jgi:uncharacterized protein (DUF2062 family)
MKLFKTETRQDFGATPAQRQELAKKKKQKMIGSIIGVAIATIILIIATIWLAGIQGVKIKQMQDLEKQQNEKNAANAKVNLSGIVNPITGQTMYITAYDFKTEILDQHIQKNWDFRCSTLNSTIFY